MQPNILIVMADQLTAKALNCYGNRSVISPNIDKLAAQGAQFNYAYTSSPLCTPARYAFMTGQNISRCGGYDNASYMPATMPTFAHYLRLMGYRTCLSGKMHFVGPDQLHGFEERLTTDVYPADFGWVPDWCDPDERIDLWYHNMSSVQQAGVAAITNQLAYDDEVGAQAVRALYDHARSVDERPLCLVTSFIHPHDPYAARQQYWDQYEKIDIPLPTIGRLDEQLQDNHTRRLLKVIDADAIDVSDEDIVRARRAYYSNVTYIDEWLGRLRSVLEECGLADNTLIMFTSDHGDMLGEYGLWYKMSFREWSCRIPTIIHYPKWFGHSEINNPVSHVDILPTLLDVASNERVQAPPAIDPLDGRSLLPLCQQDFSGDSNTAMSEYLAEGTAAPMLMICRGQIKYICCPTDEEQLFDLQQDPDEQVNLISDAGYQDILQTLRLQAQNHWDVEDLKCKVITDQNRRRSVHAALRVGKYQSWDYNPSRDASEQYTRSHMDLTQFDIHSRYPRPVPFKRKQ